MAASEFMEKEQAKQHSHTKENKMCQSDRMIHNMRHNVYKTGPVKIPWEFFSAA